MNHSLWDKVRHVLLEEWDPIGIGPASEVGGPEDEYDSHARDLVEIIDKGAGLVELRTYLAAAENHIGVQPSQPRVQRVAKLLSELTP